MSACGWRGWRRGRGDRPVLLEIEDLNLRFGGLHAVRDVRLQVPKGALYGIIGPNGAGTTTVFNLISGVYRPDSGDIRLDGQSLVGPLPSQVEDRAVARAVQTRR